MTSVPPTRVARRIATGPLLAAAVVALSVAMLALLLVWPTARHASAPLRDGQEQSLVAGSDDDVDDGEKTITIAGVGDTILGTVPHLPPDDGAGFFDRVADDLTADVVFGNLEGALSTRADFTKCGEEPGDDAPEGCAYLRMPPHYATLFAEAGFDVLNIANNHGHDSGPAGLDDTRRVLDEAGVRLSGVKGEIVELDVDGVTVAVVGVAAYDLYTNLLDLRAVSALVEAADRVADVVVFSMHVGAEGTDARHVTGQHEEYYGEPRGNTMEVAHTAVDAGADVVFGHGPHVLRGIEYYNGRLIVHSLGNFAGYGVLDATGALGRGAIVTVRVTAEGEFVAGSVTATRMVDGGYPALDPSNGAWFDFNELADDFGNRGVTVDGDGNLNQPVD